MDEAESNSSVDCKIILSDANETLETGVVDYLDNASITYKEFLNTSLNLPVQPKGGTLNLPVQPKGGTLLLYDLGPDETQWESNKKKLRLVYIYMHIYACIFTNFVCSSMHS